ncbi:MAG TPA: SAM-dependent methyltransferase [Opitutaceae bacterium]|nr:SAM-dependent methyltransferase [Opitutaceae bacterium]
MSPAFLDAFRARSGPAERLSFADFVALALYDPAVGYYRRARARVGAGPDADFVTSTSAGPLFGELVAAAAAALLEGEDPARFAFVEIGAEGPGLLEGRPHPFASFRAVRAGAEPALAGPCVVFSNELFDAQPFRRFAFRRGAWRELGVALAGAALAEVELAETALPPPLAALPPPAEGYVIDAPSGAGDLLGRLAAPGWSGLFLACDYGKSWRDLSTATPAGTARAYHRHRQESDLLARPGEQDLTCHVCWDWLEADLAAGGFGSIRLDSQEAFFVRHASTLIERIVGEDAGRVTPRKSALLQLIHPSNFGQKFQVLSGRRS